MILETLHRGQSAPIDLTLEDSDGNALNIATLDDIWVSIYHDASLVEMENYQDTLGTITTVDAAAGEIRVILNDDDTEDKITGIYAADVRTSETDVAYAANTRFRAASGQVFILKNLEA